MSIVDLPSRSLSKGTPVSCTSVKNLQPGMSIFSYTLNSLEFFLTAGYNLANTNSVTTASIAA